MMPPPETWIEFVRVGKRYVDEFFDRGRNKDIILGDLLRVEDSPCRVDSNLKNQKKLIVRDKARYR